MRQILMILFTFITCTASAQVYQRMPQHGYEMDRGRILLDLDIPSDTTTNKSGIARIGLTLYAGNGTYWTAAATATIDTTNLSYRIDTTVKYVRSPDGSVLITSNGDTINFTTTGAANNASPSSYLNAPADLTVSTDTVSFNPNLTFVLNGVRDTITVGQEWKVRTLGGDSTQKITVYLSTAGAVDTLQGTIVEGLAVPRTSSDVAIVLGYINVSSAVEVGASNQWQRTANVYIGDNGQFEADSVTNYYNKTTRIHTTGGFETINEGGVALQMANGSDIRSDERMYLTSASTMMFRVNGFSKSMAIYPTGNVGIGGADVDVPSAILNLFDSTSKGFLPPVMRGVRMNAISSPATGLIVYNSDSLSLCLYNGSAWVKLGSGGGGGSGSTPTLDAVVTEGNEILNKSVIVRTDPPNLSDDEIEITATGGYTGGPALIVRDGVPLVQSEYGGFGVRNYNNNYLFPNGVGDSSWTFPLSFTLNGGYYTANSSTGVVDFGTVGGGGSVDSSNFLTKTATQTVLGSTTFANTTVGSQNLLISGGRQGGSDNVGLLVGGTFAGATNAHPLRVAPTFSPTSDNFSIALFDAPGLTGGTANIDHIAGYQSVMTHGSTGTMQEAYGAYFGFVNNGGNVTNRYAAYFADASGSGTIANNVPIFIANQTKGTTNLGIQVAGSTGIEVGGISYLLGNAIVGHTTGVAPGADLEVRNAGAVSFRMRNNSNWYQFTQPSGSSDLALGSLSGNGFKYYSGGNAFKTFFAPGQDSVSNSGVWINQSFANAYRASSSSAITITANDHTFNSDATSSSVTVNLPTAVGCKGRLYVIRKSDAGVNTVTIDANGTETINGATTLVLSTQYQTRTIQSDGANWMIINAYL